MPHRAILVFLVFLLCPGLLRAEPIADLDAPAYAGSGPTFRQLVLSVFTGAKEDPTSGELVLSTEKVLRQPGTTKQRTTLSEGTKLGACEYIRVRGDGSRSYLILHRAASDPESDSRPDGGASVLAVFPEGDSEPQDVADVKSDQLTSLMDQPPLLLGQDDGFIVKNHHFNSNQGYLDTSLFHIRQGRLRRVGNIFTFTLRGMCARSFEQTLGWRTEPGGANPYPAVVATVTLTMGPGEYEAQGCPKRPPARPKTYSQTWKWDQTAERYQKAGDGLRELERFNRDKF